MDLEVPSNPIMFEEMYFREIRDTMINFLMVDEIEVQINDIRTVDTNLMNIMIELLQKKAQEQTMKMNKRED